jgi:hypothetical protein
MIYAKVQGARGMAQNRAGVWNENQKCVKNRHASVYVYEIYQSLICVYQYNQRVLPFELDMQRRENFITRVTNCPFSSV